VHRSFGNELNQQIGSQNYGIITAPASSVCPFSKPGKLVTVAGKKIQAGEALIRVANANCDTPRLATFEPALPEPINGSAPNAHWKHDNDEQNEEP